MIDFTSHIGPYASWSGIPKSLLFPYQFDQSLDGGSHNFVYHIDAKGDIIHTYLFRWSNFDRRDGKERQVSSSPKLQLFRLEATPSGGQLVKMSASHEKQVLSNIESTLKDLLSEKVFLSYYSGKYPFSDEVSEESEDIFIDMDETVEEERARHKELAFAMNHSNSYEIIQLIKSYRN